MALTTEKQIQETVCGKDKILIVTAKDYDGDRLSASLAWFLFLKKWIGKDKEIDVCIENFSLMEKFSFLPKIDSIKSNVEECKNFVINMDVSDIDIDEISYDLKDNNLNFIINVKKGTFEGKEVVCKRGGFKYDIIFSIGAPDLESLGNFYDMDPEFFYKVPIINIDCSAKNEQFGQINLVDLTATSNSEIIFDLIKSIDAKLMDHDIATALLAGIIDKTRSFKAKNVTPKSLSIASALMSENARKEEIISNLFRTKTVTGLKLWGKALARLKMDEKYKIVWSLITNQDFIYTNTGERHLLEVIEEFITSIPEAKIIIILYEKGNNEICGLVKISNSHDAQELAKIFTPEGSRSLSRFILKDKNLLTAEKEVIEEIKRKLGEVE